MCLNSTLDLEEDQIVKKYEKYRRSKFANSFRECENDEPLDDALSVTTHYTKLFLRKISTGTQRIQQSKFCTIITKTTQPAHLLTVLALIFILYIWRPHLEDQKTLHFAELSKFFYLGSFCVYLGSQIWMTFVSGLSLYFSLPRHNFGDVQRVLFPKYFALNAFLTLSVLISYSSVTTICSYQAVTLSTTFLINLLIRLYLTAPLLKCMAIKNRIEAVAGLGKEIGRADVRILQNCPIYMKIYRSFRRIHMTIACGNIICMSCSIIHLYYLSSKLCFAEGDHSTGMGN